MHIILQYSFNHYLFNECYFEYSFEVMLFWIFIQGNIIWDIHLRLIS